MSKFKKGDLVICREERKNLTEGCIYKIRHTFLMGGDFFVEIINDSGFEDQYYESRFELLLDTGDGSTSYKPKSSCIILEV